MQHLISLSWKVKFFDISGFALVPQNFILGSLVTLFYYIVGERKKSVRLNTEFNRSVSVPAERAQARLPGHSSAPNQTPTTPEPE